MSFLLQITETPGPPLLSIPNGWRGPIFLGNGEKEHGKLWYRGDFTQSARLARGEGKSLHFVGRLRLDRRDQLIKKLGAPHSLGTDAAGDAQTCLHAYARWEDNFIDHIEGDFAFAIWDEDRRKLVCASQTRACSGRLGRRSADWPVA